MSLKKEMQLMKVAATNSSSLSESLIVHKDRRPKHGNDCNLLLVHSKPIIKGFTSISGVRFLPSTTVVVERSCFHKRVSRILSGGRCRPPSRHPPHSDTPFLGKPPWADTPYQTSTAADGMLLTRMHSCSGFKIGGQIFPQMAT